MLTKRKLINEGKPNYRIPKLLNLEYNTEKASCRHRLVIMNTVMITMLNLANLEFVLIVGPEI